MNYTWNEEDGLEGDAEMEDVENEEDDSDSDYDPDRNQDHQGVDLSEVMNGMRDLKMFMTQRFDAQDLQF